MAKQSVTSSPSVSAEILPLLPIQISENQISENPMAESATPGEVQRVQVDAEAAEALAIYDEVLTLL